MASERAVGGWTPGGGNTLYALPDSPVTTPKEETASVSAPFGPSILPSASSRLFAYRTLLPPFTQLLSALPPSTPLRQLSSPVALVRPRNSARPACPACPARCARGARSPQPPYYVPTASDDPTSNRYPRAAMSPTEPPSAASDFAVRVGDWCDDHCCSCCGWRCNEACSYACVGCCGAVCGGCSAMC